VSPDINRGCNSEKCGTSRDHKTREQTPDVGVRKRGNTPKKGYPRGDEGGLVFVGKEFGKSG